VSHHAAAKAVDRLSETVHSSLRLAACLTFPATAGLIALREPIVRLLYERGSFMAADTVQTSRAVLFYSLALFAYSAVKILVPAFYALGDTRSPVRASVTSVALKIAVNFVLIVRMGFLGLALSTAVASWANFALLQRQMDRATHGGSWRRDVGTYVRVAAASTLMGLAAALVFRMSAWLLPGSSFFHLAVQLGAAMASGAAVILPLLQLLKVTEAGDLQVWVSKRFSRR
jgi:putative peptidoglycan lipid II flippase